MQGNVFWGSIWYCFPFWRWNRAKSRFWGYEMAFSSPACEILKLAYYRQYCTKSNQILHSEKEHQMLFVEHPHRRITNPRLWMVAILKKWEIVISQQRFDHSAWNLAWWRALTLRAVLADKFLNLKKMPYIGHVLTDQHESLQSDAHLPLTLWTISAVRHDNVSHEKSTPSMRPFMIILWLFGYFILDITPSLHWWTICDDKYVTCDVSVQGATFARLHCYCCRSM